MLAAVHRSRLGSEIDLSVVVPVRDEAANLEQLYERVCSALDSFVRWELLVIDDGSRDGSCDVIRMLAEKDARVRGASLAQPCGQSSAIFLGVDLARGALIATLDGDLQNDPADLRTLVEGLRGYDAVVGYRVRRQDGVVRRISSRIANVVRDALSGDHVTDTGCSLKVFRADALRSVPRFEGMHRFLPTLLRYQYFRVAELPVSHHPRTAGHSKYGIRNRMLRAFIDLLVVRWMRSRMARPPVRMLIGRCEACDETDA